MLLPLDELIAEVARRTEKLYQYRPHVPHPKQKQFLDVDAAEALYGGAAGGGKSDALLMGALDYVHVPGYAAIIFRRTFAELSLPGAIMDRAHEWLDHTDAHWSGERKTWTFPSGATLTFAYLDTPKDHFRYQSSEFQYIAFDELTQWASPRQYVYLFSRLRRLAGSRVPLRMRAATNPGGVGHRWVKRRFLDRPGERVFVPATLEDNPSLDRALYEASLAQLDTVTREQLRHGRWIEDTSGLVYRYHSENAIPELPPLDPGERWNFVLACDFGVTSGTSFTVLAFREHDPVCYVVESEKWAGLDSIKTAHLARAWEQRYVETWGYGFERTVGDVGGLGKDFQAVWAQHYGIPLSAAAKTNKLGYIKVLNGDLENRLLRIVEPTCQPLIDELVELGWADDKHQREHPDHPNHCADGMLYGWRVCRHWDFEPSVPDDAHPDPLGSPLQQELAEMERIERLKDAQDDDAGGSAWILGPA